MFFRHALFAGDRVIPPSTPLSSFHPVNVLRKPVASALLCGWLKVGCCSEAQLLGMNYFKEDNHFQML